jgi:hypothetical protein
MKKYKDKIKLVNMLLSVLNKLKTTKLQHIQGELADFSFKCSEVTKNSNIFDAAINKCWFKSAETIRSRVSRNLCDFTHHLNQFKDIVNSTETKQPKFSDIFADLNQVEQEFGELKFDLKTKTLSVITEPIALEEIPLGPFEIRLFINQMSKLYSDSPYKIIALEPNPAGSDSNVTHPHVSNEKLCEGDGFIPIRQAIQQGRLCDFFTIIVQILQTYNPDSPYVSLDDWEGISCYDCGCTVAGDDCYYCEDCQRDYCSSCSTYCQICDTTICMGCSYECPSCNQPVCKHCTAMCSECEERFCNDCINEQGLCQNCEEQRKEQEYEEENQETEKSQTSLAIQSDSVG